MVNRCYPANDERVLAEIVRDHRNILVVEEGTVVNGFGAHMSAVIGEMDPAVKVVAHRRRTPFVTSKAAGALI